MVKFPCMQSVWRRTKSFVVVFYHSSSDKSKGENEAIQVRDSQATFVLLLDSQDAFTEYQTTLHRFLKRAWIDVELNNKTERRSYEVAVEWGETQW